MLPLAVLLHSFNHNHNYTQKNLFCEKLQKQSFSVKMKCLFTQMSAVGRKLESRVSECLTPAVICTFIDIDHRI